MPSTLPTERPRQEVTQRQGIGPSAVPFRHSPCLRFSVSPGLVPTPAATSVRTVRGLARRPPRPPLSKGGSAHWGLVAVAVFVWCGSARGDRPVALSELAVDQVALK